MTTNHTDLIRRLRATWQRMHEDLAWRPAPKLLNAAADALEAMRTETGRLVDKSNAYIAENSRLASALEAMQAENFKLAAGQCANVTADEGGRPYCKEIESLRARLEAMQAALEQIVTMAERGLGLDPSSMDNYFVWIQEKARAAIDAARGQESAHGIGTKETP